MWLWGRVGRSFNWRVVRILVYGYRRFVSREKLQHSSQHYHLLNWLQHWLPVLQLFPESELTASGTCCNLRNGERERTIHHQYTSLHNRKVVVLWRGRVCLYISISSSLYPLTELVISYLHTSCECFRRFLVRVYFIVRGVAMRCVTSSPVLIWLGCTLCTCKVCRLRLRRCQRSTRASVWDWRSGKRCAVSSCLAESCCSASYAPVQSTSTISPILGTSTNW